jgi:hypothetical protein
VIDWLKEHASKIAFGLVVMASLAVADARYLMKTSFEQWAKADYCGEMQAELREVRREVDRLETALKWASDERERATLETELRGYQRDEQTLSETISRECQ